MNTTAAKKALIITALVLPFFPWSYFGYELFLAPGPAPNRSGDLAAMISLKTPGNLRVAVMGDTRGNTEAMEAILEDASVRADLAFILGDLVWRGSTPRFLFARREIAESAGNLPVFTAIGNHDLVHGEKDPRLFVKFFGPTTYWLRHENVLFLVIDNCTSSVWQGQLAWLRTALKEQARPGDAVFLFMHKPPRPEGEKDFYGMSEGKSRELGEVIAGHPNLKIIASHLHDFLEYRFNGVPVWVSGEAGAPQKRAVSQYSYLLLDCHASDCRVEKIEMGHISEGWLFVEQFELMYFFWGWPPVFLIAIIVLLRRSQGRKKDDEGEN